MPRITVGALGEFPNGRGVGVRIGDRRLAVFRVGDAVYAIDDACPHRDFPLYDGTVNGLVVRCRTHGSCFNLATGALVRGPARRGVRTYRAAIVGDQIEVELTD